MTDSSCSRRRALSAAAAALAAGTLASGASAQDAAEGDKIKILAISGSARKGKTTAGGLQAVLEAAKAVSPKIEVELIELSGMKFEPPGSKAADDFEALAVKLTDPKVAAIVLGSPTYFANMSGLMKSFLDKWTAFRKGFALKDKVAGTLAVGAARNGGQELVNESMKWVLMSMQMVLVGDGEPTGHRGATLWNQKDDVTADEWGMGTAKALGTRVAQTALRLRGQAAK